MQTPPYIYGTQYYRAPTPLPEEWEGDMPRIKELGLNTIILRVQWRKNEPRHNEYDFSDVDRLMELAQKHGLLVGIQLMLETAPDYVYEDLGGERIGLDGVPIKRRGNGAFYIGGWLPCFDNPKVMKRALEFSRKAVERYRDCDNLLLWSVWNEPRTRPIGECCCPHSLASYRQWLREQFGTIENLDRQFGKGWEAFETIATPGCPVDYTDLYLWRKWALTRVTDRIRQVRNLVQSLDSKHQVMTHVGSCSVFQDVAGDGSDDFENAKGFSFYGTSFPCGESFQHPEEQALPFFFCDWLRNICPDFWVFELYPDWGAWQPRIPDTELRYKIMATLGGGSKGLVYWQYRAERLGNESDLAGLVNSDGSFKAPSLEGQRCGAVIGRNAEFLRRAHLATDRIAIVYDQSSDLINRVENTARDWSMNTPYEMYLYKRELRGFHALLHSLGLVPDFVDSRALPNRIDEYDTIILPAMYIVPETWRPLFDRFVARGGKVVADEGFALRQRNTWINFPWPGQGWSDFFHCQYQSREAAIHGPYTARFDGQAITLPANNFHAVLEPGEGAATMASWQDGTPAITAFDNRFFVGFALGDCAMRHELFPMARTMLAKILGVTSRKWPEGVTVRHLTDGQEDRHLVFNRNHTAVTFPLDGSELTVAAQDSILWQKQN